jgi:hypothetical protein
MELTFGIIIFLIILAFSKWYYNRRHELVSMEDCPLETVDEILNSKVPAEKRYVTVQFGKDIIQMSEAEFLVWGTWDRKRKREFVREFRKIKKSDLA